jgi:hypothetical protein
VAKDKLTAGGGVSYKKFMDMDPPIFLGKTDPEATKNWLREIKRIFRMLKVLEDHRSILGHID